MRFSTSTRVFVSLGLLVMAGALPGQRRKDDRDVIRLKTGKELRGRVLNKFGERDLVWVNKSGARKRIAWKKVAGTETVNDRLREFFTRASAAGRDSAAQFRLAQWADSAGLEAMARLVALRIVLADDSHRAAHEFLGNKPGRRGTWRWRAGSRLRTRAAHDKYFSDMGHPFDVSSEHFRVETNAGMPTAVATLFDLERLYLFWMEEFGKELRLQESLRPIRIRIWASEHKFPAQSGRKEAFVFTRNGADFAATFLPTPTPAAPGGAAPAAGAVAQRPWRIFTIATQALVERTLTLQKNEAGNGLERTCAWAEVGLAQWVASCMHGAPGEAKPRGPSFDKLALRRVLATQPKLTRVTHLRYRRFLDPGRRAEEAWDGTLALVHFFMDRSMQPNYREPFLRFLIQAFYEGKGDSSSALDRALGVKIERLQKPFESWVARHAK